MGKKAKKAARVYSRNPFYNWVVYEILLVFDFLVSEWEMKRKPVEADGRGCWIRYQAARLAVVISAEMGGPPECEVIIDGRRRSLTYLIATRWPDSKVPPRPEYEGTEKEKSYFSDVLRRYASILRSHKNELMPE